MVTEYSFCFGLICQTLGAPARLAVIGFFTVSKVSFLARLKSQRRSRSAVVPRWWGQGWFVVTVACTERGLRYLYGFSEDERGKFQRMMK